VRILGVNTRFYPKAGTYMGTHDENPPPTRAVLVEGDIGDYTCYVGHGSAEWVALHGDKISFEEACCHFPGGQLDRKKYRD
jgi:hypothetical protein